jgi:hypothetical protein
LLSSELEAERFRFFLRGHVTFPEVPKTPKDDRECGVKTVLLSTLAEMVSVCKA